MGRQPRNPRRSPTTPTSAGFETPGLPPPLPPASSAGQKPLYLCSPFVEAALVKGNFKTIVMLPKYVDVTEWVAVNSERTYVRVRQSSHAHARSIRVLSKSELVLWCRCRMLHRSNVSYHVSRSQVCLVQPCIVFV